MKICSRFVALMSLMLLINHSALANKSSEEDEKSDVSKKAEHRRMKKHTTVSSHVEEDAKEAAAPKEAKGLEKQTGHIDELAKSVREKCDTCSMSNPRVFKGGDGKVGTTVKEDTSKMKSESANGSKKEVEP